MIKPKRLQKGDKVAIVSLSRGMLGESMFIHKYEIAKKRLEEDYSLEVIVMPNALKGIDYLYARRIFRNFPTRRHLSLWHRGYRLEKRTAHGSAAARRL